MKKIFCLIAAITLMTACDDGDMSFRTFDFSNQENPTACSLNTDIQTTTETYYKVNDTEGLILTLPKGVLINSLNIDPETGLNLARKIVLTGSNTLTYYDFTSKPTSLCTASEIPAFNEKWTGEGTLSVMTYADLDSNNKLRGYIHEITMENVSFKNNGETITIVDSEFGNVTKKFGFTFNFISTGQTEPIVQQCPTSTLLYTLKSPEVLTISVADFDTVFQNESRTQTFDILETTASEVLFNVYNGSAGVNNVCGQGSQVPSQPIQRWEMSEGQLVIVSRLGTGNVYVHDIYLKDARFVSSQNGSFYIQDLVDVEPEGYFFGTYQPTP